MLEFSLGQKFQRGDIGVFRGIHPRLAGIGLASVFSAYAITLYYNIIIAIALVYFFAAWSNPLPWSVQYTDETGVYKKDGCRMPIAQEYLNKDVLHIIDENCVPYDTADYIAGGDVTPSQFQFEIFGCMILVWILIFFCVFKGVKSSSYVVWVTVPLPCVFMIIMVLKGLTLENADEGIRWYLLGIEDGVAPDVKEKLSQTAMWTQACSQIFFSIGVCMGVMTSYSSYNQIDKPIIGDSFRVAIGNSLFSFIAGFAVFSVIGYLKANSPIVASSVASFGLAFVAYPTSIEMLPGPNFWTLVLSIVLFTLGIDSAFSLIEATSTVIYDTQWGKNTPRKVVALILCVVGMLFSTLFCSNWGYTYLDVADHYIANYLMLGLGILQCFGAGWILDAKSTAEQFSKRSVYILTIGYWVWLILWGAISIFTFDFEQLWITILVFWVVALLIIIASCVLSGQGFKKWYQHIFLSGVFRLARSMTKLSVPAGTTDDNVPFWVYIFEAWWAISIKYFIPWAIWWLLLVLLRQDLPTAENEGKGYGGYHPFWQWMGLLYPIAGLLCFIIPVFTCTKHEDLDAEKQREVDEALDTNWLKAPSAVEMTKQ